MSYKKRVNKFYKYKHVILYMAIKIDKEKCIGCGMCESVCPEVFEINNDMKAQVKIQKKIPCVKEAVENCPVAAIKE